MAESAAMTPATLRSTYSSSSCSRHRNRRPAGFILTGAIAAMAAISIQSQLSAAQFTYTPVNSAADLWSAGTNWSGVPVSAVDTRLTFVGNNAAVLADGIANTNADDISGAFQLNILDLQGTGPANGGAVVNVNSTSPATGLTLITSAATPVVNLNALAGSSGLAYNVNSALSLANNTLFAGTGTATFNFNGGVSGSGVMLTKSGSSTLRLGGTTTLASLAIGSNTAGGSVIALAGSNLSVGTGLAGQTLSIGAAAGTASTGTLDVSASSSLNVNVPTVVVGSTGSGGTGQGILTLSSSNNITAGTSFVIANSGSVFNNVTSTVTAPAGSSTSIQTPILTIGGNKSRGEFILGSGALLDLTGISGARAAMTVGSTNAGGGSGSWTGLANFTNGTFHGYLSSLVIGNRTVTSSTASVDGTMTLSINSGNHLDVNGSSATLGGVVVIGRALGGTTTGTATGTLTIGNLDSSSQIVSTNNGTAILLGVNGTGPTGSGTLNLNGGTLGITTTGSAIAGGTGTSTVNFNGTTLKAGASSGSWISGLTNANVSTGGAKIDSNGFSLAVPQALVHDPALGATPDGGLMKFGAGALILSGSETYTGSTIVNDGELMVIGNVTGGGAVAANFGTVLGGTGTISGATTIAGGATLRAGDGISASGALTLGGNLVLNDNSVIQLALGSALTHSSLARTGSGLWAFDNDQAFSLVNAGATVGTYDNVISGLSTDPGAAAWIIATSGFVGTFSYDGAGGVDLTVTSVPEPRAVTALIGGIGVLLGLRHRRKN